ncbi:MAG: TIGR03960 family B12-binding radical SAM protein, partial [Candidatus Eisenbacteria bacterium]|nr:TIGR03960 family B12-binding radical SAM protein [Candidatus Eisenbacteria bacterium]
MNSLHEAIERILPLVAKPSRYLGNEFHAVRKDPASVAVQWLLILPEVYEIGMSHWGLKILYEILNKRPDTLAERAYCPWLDMEARMRAASIPFFSLESRRPAREFDLVGFSLQYEMTCTNILTCLDLAGIPLWAEERGDADPFVIGGGPCVTNPEPLAPFFDLFLIGDGEETVHRITEVVRDTKGLPREQRLRAFAQIRGLYVPGLYEPRYADNGRLLGTFPRVEGIPARPARTFVTDLEDAPYPETPLVPLQEVVQDRLSIEVLRGCTQGCRFCQAGYYYRPLRERSPKKILEIAEKGLAASGWDGVSLVSLSTADYTQLEPLAETLNRRFAAEKISISLPSLRADRFGVGIADKVREVKRTGFTFAPEAGSERLRRAINKQVSDEEFFAAARIAYERGWRLIKTYMMIGLPTETWEDVEGILGFARRIGEIGRQYGPGCKVNVSVGAFVPKSHTPFQWDPFEDLASLREKIEYLRRELPSRTARLKWNEIETSHMEAVLSRGDRRLARTIHRAWQLGGRYDGWTEHFSHERWMRALEETGLTAEMFTRRFEQSEVLPWDHIDIGVLKKFLVRERKKTDEMGATADCRHGDCVACGIPGMPKDTRLTAPLDEEAARELRERAGAKAERRSSGGVLWPIRIRFAKEGPARFLSHLETGTILARAFRMAQIPVGHTQGHHPHPRFHFGPPLPVGVSSAVELLDVEIERPWTAAMAEALNAVLPGGFHVLEARALSVPSGTRRK